MAFEFETSDKFVYREWGQFEEYRLNPYRSGLKNPNSASQTTFSSEALETGSSGRNWQIHALSKRKAFNSDWPFPQKELLSFQEKSSI